METNLRLCGLIVIVTVILKLQKSCSILVIGKDFLIVKLSLSSPDSPAFQGNEKHPRHASTPGELCLFLLPLLAKEHALLLALRSLGFKAHLHSLLLGLHVLLLELGRGRLAAGLIALVLADHHRYLEGLIAHLPGHLHAFA